LPFTSACSGGLGKSADSSGSTESTISIVTPASMGKMGSLPSDRKVCYGANIKGPGIDSSADNSCAIPAGVLSKFVEPGATLEVSVPKGSDREVELFAYLQPAGQNTACDSLTVDLGTASKLQGMYKVGSADNVDASSNKNISIDVEFPGLNTNVADQYALPDNCAGVFVPLKKSKGFDISSQKTEVSGGGLTLVGGAGGLVTQ